MAKANRIILGAVMALALTLTPRLAQAVPTKTVVKKKSPTKAQTKVSKTQKNGKKSKAASSRSRRRSPVQADLVQFPTTQSPVPAVKGVETSSVRPVSSTPETPPLMKVIPQRDGRFLLEPLSPKKSPGPVSRATTKPEPPKDTVASAEQRYNRFEPWNFSDLIMTQAKHYRDTPYCRGGNLNTGYATDCSGFVQYIYKGFQIDLPRSSAEQAQVGKVVTQNMDFSKMLPGDLLFFRRGGRGVGHAGIYLGEGKMIHASNQRLGVTVTDLRQPYYAGTFVVAKRVFEVKYPQQ